MPPLPIVMSAVCRRWRHIIFGFAALWTTLTTSIVVHRHFALHARVLSRALPVKIYYRVTSCLTSSQILKIAAFSSRISSLVVAVDSFVYSTDTRRKRAIDGLEGRIHDVLYCSMPRLTSIRLTWNITEFAIRVQPEFIRAPLLQVVSLHGVGVDSWRFGSHLEVHTIDLSGVIQDPALHLDEFLENLSVLPALHTLIIDGSIPTCQDHSPIVLTHFRALRRLFVRDSLDRVRDFSRRVAAPLLTISCLWVGLCDDVPPMDTYQDIGYIFNSDVVRFTPVGDVPVDVLLFFEVDDYTRVDIIGSKSSATPPFHPICVRPNSLYDSTDRDDDARLAREGGLHTSFTVYSTDDLPGLGSNPNILHAELATRSCILQNLSSPVRHLLVRGPMHAVNEYTSNVAAEHIHIDARWEFMPGWVWGVKRTCRTVCLENAVMTEDSLTEFVDFARHRDTEVKFLTCNIV